MMRMMLEMVKITSIFGFPFLTPRASADTLVRLGGRANGL